MPHTILHAVSSLDRHSSAEQLLSLLALRRDFGGTLQQRVMVLGSPQGVLADSFASLDVDVDFLWQRWRLDPSTVGRIATAFCKQQPDVIHAWDSSALHYVQAAAVVAKVPRLVAEWDLDVLDGSMPDPTRLLPVARPMANYVTSNRRVDDWLRRRFPDERVKLIPSAARTPLDKFWPRETLFDKLSLPEDAVLIGTSCPLSVEFGVKELIWAADMVRSLHPNVRYLIAGDGPERRHLEQFASTAAIPENIVFLGDTERWGDILPHLDVYWQGSAPMASSPTMPLDAMAAGVPVVASDTPQHRDWIEHERTGYLVGYDARADRTRITNDLVTELSTAKAIASAAIDYVTHHHAPVPRATAYRDLYVDLLERIA